MELTDLEDLLDDYLPAGWSLETTRKGEIIIRTNCRKNDAGELVSMDEDLDEDVSFDDDDSISLDESDD